MWLSNYCRYLTMRKVCISEAHLDICFEALHHSLTQTGGQSIYFFLNQLQLNRGGVFVALHVLSEGKNIQIIGLLFCSTVVSDLLN